MDYLTLRRPDDMHLHLREGEQLHAVVAYTARQFGRAVVMPNLAPPVTSHELAAGYREKILGFAKQTAREQNFEPLMTIYLTDNTTPEDIRLAKGSGIVVAAKLYPANATTNSAAGVKDIKQLFPVFLMMEEVGLVLCVHGETLVSKVFGDATRQGRVGQLRREAVFLKETLAWLVETFPKLKIVLEHITTKEAVDFVAAAPENVAATITAHHLLATLDDALASHHNMCMPVLKEEEHRQALLAAATSGNPKFFGGTDSAPHSKSRKETACGCAGCFTAPHAVELYAQAFEENGGLYQLELFLSLFGGAFYGLPPNEGTIKLERQSWAVPNELPFGEGETIVPFFAGRTLNWKVV